MQGVVKTFLPEKKYGFIKGDDGKDYFFHVRAFKDKQQVEKICEEVRIDFEQVATPKGYQAKQCSLVNAEDVKTFIVPETFIVSKLDNIKGWETIEDGEWVVHGCSRDSPDAARKEMISRAESLGANALVSAEYYKETGSEEGTSLHGEHKFTIHCFRGRMVVVAKRNALGHQKMSDLLGMNSRATALKENFMERYDKEMRRYKVQIALFLCVVAYVGFITPLGVAPSVAVTLFVAAFFFSRQKPDGDWLQRAEGKVKVLI